METQRRQDTSRLSRMLNIYMVLQFDHTNWFPVKNKSSQESGSVGGGVGGGGF